MESVCSLVNPHSINIGFLSIICIEIIDLAYNILSLLSDISI